LEECEEAEDDDDVVKFAMIAARPNFHSKRKAEIGDDAYPVTISA